MFKATYTSSISHQCATFAWNYFNYNTSKNEQNLPTATSTYTQNGIELPIRNRVFKVFRFPYLHSQSTEIEPPLQWLDQEHSDCVLKNDVDTSKYILAEILDDKLFTSSKVSYKSFNLRPSRLKSCLTTPLVAAPLQIQQNCTFAALIQVTTNAVRPKACHWHSKFSCWWHC